MLELHIYIEQLRACAEQHNDAQFAEALSSGDPAGAFESFRSSLIHAKDRCIGTSSTLRKVRQRKKKSKATPISTSIETTKAWFQSWKDCNGRSLCEKKTRILAQISSSWDRSTSEIDKIIRDVAPNTKFANIIDYIRQQVTAFEKQGSSRNIKRELGTRRLELVLVVRSFHLWAQRRGLKEEAYGSVIQFSREAWLPMEYEKKAKSLRRMIRAGKKWMSIGNPEMLLAIKGDGDANRVFETTFLDKRDLTALAAYLRTLKIYSYRVEFIQYFNRLVGSTWGFLEPGGATCTTSNYQEFCDEAQRNRTETYDQARRNRADLSLEAAFNQNSTPISTRDYGAPIFVATIEGSIDKIQSLLQSAQASIWDRDPYGLGLTYYAIYYCWWKHGSKAACETYNYLIINGLDAQTSPQNDELELLPAENLHDWVMAAKMKALSTEEIPLPEMEHDVSSREFNRVHRALLRLGGESLELCLKSMPAAELSETIDAPDRSGRSPLAWAVEFCHVDGIELLTAFGADPRQHRKTPSGYHSPLLHLAVAGPESCWMEHDRLRTIETLLRLGADCNDVDDGGWSALHLAASWDLLDVTESMEHHCGEILDWNARTVEDETFLDVCDNDSYKERFASYLTLC